MTDFLNHPLGVAIVMLFVGSVLSLGVWMVRGLGDLRSILIGADGENGVRGDVRAIKQARADEQRLREKDIALQTRMLTQLERVQEDVNDLDSRVQRLERPRSPAA